MNEFKLKYLDLYKGLYESELKRKDEIDKLLSFPITILSIFAGTTYFVVKQYLDRWDGTLSWFDWGFFGLSLAFVGLFLTTAYFLIRVFFGVKRSYKFLPNTSEITAHKDALIQFYEQQLQQTDGDPGKSEADKAKDEALLKTLTTEFNLDLLKWYTNCTAKNAEINDQRNEYYYEARKFIVVSSIAFILVSFVGLLNLFVMSDKNKKPEKPNDVRSARPTPPTERSVKGSQDVSKIKGIPPTKGTIPPKKK